MELKNLVPPLNLCKLIPDGEFGDSAFLWEAVVDMNTGETVNTHTVPRPSRIGCNPFVYHEIAKEFHLYPAPTLQEIMDALPQGVELSKDSEWFCSLDMTNEYYDKTPLTAAMKLWLKLKGIEYAE